MKDSGLMADWLKRQYGITQLTSFALSADLASRALKSYIYNFNYISDFSFLQGGGI